MHNVIEECMRNRPLPLICISLGFFYVIIMSSLRENIQCNYSKIMFLIYRNSLNFRCKNIFVRRKRTKLFYSKFLLQRIFFERIFRTPSTCAYAVHAVFVALRILEGYCWTHVYPSVLKADRRSTRSKRIALHHHSICRYSIC